MMVMDTYLCNKFLGRRDVYQSRITGRSERLLHRIVRDKRFPRTGTSSVPISP